MKERVDVASAALACEVRVVCRGDQTDGLGRPREQVADVVREALQLVGPDTNLVVYDVVVCRASCALQSAVGLEVEVVFVDRRRTAIDDCARARVPIRSRVCYVRREETRVVSLPADDDRELGVIW